MAEVPKELRFTLFGRGPKFHGRAALFLEFLGLICLIMGIIAGAMSKELGLAPSYWFLMAIALWIWAFWSWFTAYFGAKEG